MRRACLNLVPLESRLTPATPVYSAGTLTVTAATGDNITIAPNGFGVPGYFTVQNNAVEFFNTAVNQPIKNLVVKAGQATTYSLTIQPNTTLNNVTVSGAVVSTQVTLDQTTVLNGYLKVTGHPLGGDDSVAIPSGASIGSYVNLALGKGNNTVNVRGGTIGDYLKILGTTGNDTVNLAADGQVVVGANFDLLLGNGTNTVTGVTAGNEVTVGKNLTFVGGTGDDQFNFSTVAARLRVGGNMTANLGASSATNDDFVRTTDLTIGGNFTGTGTSGFESFDHYGPSQIGGNYFTNLKTGDGNVSFGFTTGGGAIGRSLNVVATAGAGVFLDNLTVGKNVGISTGATGVARINFGTTQNQPVKIGGALSIKSGLGNDLYDILRTRVGGALTISTGAGVDGVQIDDSDFFGTTLIDLGAGTDTLLIDARNQDGLGTNIGAGGQRVGFAGNVTIQGGADNDAVSLSDPNTGTFASFGGNLKVLGGTGSDTLTLWTGNVYLQSKADDFELGNNL